MTGYFLTFFFSSSTHIFIFCFFFLLCFADWFSSSAFVNVVNGNRHEMKKRVYTLRKSNALVYPLIKKLIPWALCTFVIMINSSNGASIDRVETKSQAFSPRFWLYVLDKNDEYRCVPYSCTRQWPTSHNLPCRGNNGECMNYSYDSIIKLIYTELSMIYHSLARSHCQPLFSFLFLLSEWYCIYNIHINSFIALAIQHFNFCQSISYLQLLTALSFAFSLTMSVFL